VNTNTEGEVVKKTARWKQGRHLQRRKRRKEHGKDKSERTASKVVPNEQVALTWYGSSLLDVIQRERKR